MITLKWPDGETARCVEGLWESENQPLAEALNAMTEHSIEAAEVYSPNPFLSAAEAIADSLGAKVVVDDDETEDSETGDGVKF